MIPRFHPIFASSPSKTTSVIEVLHAPQLISGIFRTPFRFPKGTQRAVSKKTGAPHGFPKTPAGSCRGRHGQHHRHLGGLFRGLGRAGEREDNQGAWHGWAQGMLVGEKIGWITPSKNVILIVFRDLEGNMMITKCNLEHHLVDTKPNDRNVEIPTNKSGCTKRFD